QGAPPPRRPAKRRRGAFRRFLTFLLLLAVLAGAGAAAYLAISPGKSSVQLRQVVHDNADQVINDLTQLIQDNTR
ncbi:MAG: serine/threonine protein kinase, partial [Conexibacter sp.]|nr:serine/threonine protein kinase [Conexibacter sp.]